MRCFFILLAESSDEETIAKAPLPPAKDAG